MNTRVVRAFAAVAVLLVGCSVAPSPDSARGGRNLLTHDQLVATNSENLYDAVAKLRPEWLTSRGPTSITDETPTMVSVFMNGQQVGKAGSMREWRVTEITQVRYWPAGEAASRFGMGHPRGVIEITRN